MAWLEGYLYKECEFTKVVLNEKELYLSNMRLEVRLEFMPKYEQLCAFDVFKMQNRATPMLMEGGLLYLLKLWTFLSLNCCHGLLMKVCARI